MKGPTAHRHPTCSNAKTGAGNATTTWRWLALTVVGIAFAFALVLVPHAMAANGDEYERISAASEFEQLAFVETGEETSVSVSEATELEEAFEAPYTYKGRYFSGVTTSGADIDFEQVVTISVPAQVLDLDDADAAALENPDSAEHAHYAAYEQYGAGALRWARVQTCLDYVRLLHEDEENAKTLYRIVLPEGEYAIGAADFGRSLTLPGGVWLDMTAGTKLVQVDSTVSLLRTEAVKASEDENVLEVTKGIVIDGGAAAAAVSDDSSAADLHPLVALTSAEDVFVRGTSFTGDATTLCGLELAGVQGATVSTCLFTGMTSADASALAIRNVRDASCVQDASQLASRPCSNVVVGDSIFMTVQAGLDARAHGAHLSSSELLIQHNSSFSISDAAMLFAATRNLAIRDNTMSDCGRGIVLAPVLAGDDCTAAASDIAADVKFEDRGHCLVQSNTLTGAPVMSAGIVTSGALVGSQQLTFDDLLFKSNDVSALGTGLSVSDSSGVAIEGGEYTSVQNPAVVVGANVAVRIDNMTCCSTRNTGLCAYSGSSLQLANCTFDKCGTYGLQATGADITGIGCSFDNCGSHGVNVSGCTLRLVSSSMASCAGYGMYASGCDDIVLAGVIVTSNGKAGICLASSKASLSGCTLSANKAQGLSASKSSTAELDACALKENGSHGVAASGTCTVTLVECKLNSNKGSGASLSSSTLTASSTQAKSNKGNGFALSSMKSAKLTSCSIKSNKGRGIIAKSSKTTLQGCACSSNSKDGFYMSKGTANIKSCTFATNKANGVRAISKAKITAFKKNKIKSNKKYGIYLSGKSKMKGYSGNKFAGKKKYRRKGF